jgi:hypothetical protein
VAVSGLESTLADIMACVDRKGVKKSENLLALPASAGEEAPEREGRMDLCADQQLAEVLAAVVRRRRVAGVRVAVVVEESAVGRWRIGWARQLAAPWAVAMKEWADCQ